MWTCRADRVSEMTAVASSTWGLVFWTQDGTTHVGVTRPETRSSTVPVPDGATFIGIELAVGTWLRPIPVPRLVGAGVELPDVTGKAFTLDGHRYSMPTADDAEALVARLVRVGTVERDPLVDEVRRGVEPAVSPRTAQRRFVAATGLTAGTVRQIDRATSAARTLAAGAPVADVVAGLGYYDQAHLARALRRFVGRTATQLRARSGGALGLDLG